MTWPVEIGDTARGDQGKEGRQREGPLPSTVHRSTNENHTISTQNAVRFPRHASREILNTFFIFLFLISNFLYQFYNQTNSLGKNQNKEYIKSHTLL